MIRDFRVIYSFTLVVLPGLLSFLWVVFDKRWREDRDSKSLQFLAGDSPVEEVKNNFYGSFGLTALLAVKTLVIFGGSFSY